jgi:hypothetical protein
VALFPGNWRGTSYDFVLHWKEQVMKYEKLELKPFPLKQKLLMVQNAIVDVTEYTYIKQIGDQDIARGNAPLSYDSYTELLLLSACSTYDKKITLPGKQKHAVYAAPASSDDLIDPFEDTADGEYEGFRVDTDITDIMAYPMDAAKGGSYQNQGKPTSNLIPCD